MPNIALAITPTLFFPLVTIGLLLCFFGYYWSVILPKKGTLEWIGQREAAPMSFSVPLHRMSKKDALPLILVTVIYAFTAFFQLGSFSNPQSFQTFEQNTTVTFSLQEGAKPASFAYYPGLNTGTYTLSASADGQTWQDLPALTQEYTDLFKWHMQPLKAGLGTLQFFRLTASTSTLRLGELAFYDADGVALLPAEGGPLFDEASTVPASSTWYNSTYFDEIYHARTALEHIEGMNPYEISHPPLGKLILSIGIQLFGMTPFGWRSMGVLFGVLMLPILYVFLKNLFGKTVVALCGTALFAFDFMHLTQTRIATIDTYAVFFILCMYFFMYRYLALPKGATFRRGALPLFLSGLSWGLGAACKWTVIYAGAGLAVLYFINLFFRWRGRAQDDASPPFAPWLVKTLLFSVLCFVLIPAAIYCASYIPYAAARGQWTLQSLVGITMDNQKFMFGYHAGITTPHPYSSRWYDWLIDRRPILYYLDNATTGATGLKTAFGCFNNPVVAWGGLLALVTVGIQMVRRHCGKALFILVGFASQLLPWVFISRTTFEYHYFTSTLFLVLALSYVLNSIVSRARRGWRTAVYGITGGSVLLYAAFYPVLIGLTVPEWYTTNFLHWLPSWPF